MSTLFNNHSFSVSIFKHQSLPIYLTDEFTFFRCVNVDDWDVYGKTVSVLHAGNLRLNNNLGRYSKLFPNEKISYWADSKSTALAEMKKHNSSNNYLTFIAYDDVSSTFPTLNIDESLVIIDGRDLHFHEIILKIEDDEELTTNETEIVELIKKEKPDCLAYRSIEKEDGVNFLFFEKGFKKLALREVQLYFGELKGKNSQTIPCAVTCDYSPIIDSYGRYFEPIVKVKTDSKYEHTEEYKLRNIYRVKAQNKLREIN